MFRYSTLSGPENVPATSAPELLNVARELPVWDALILVAEGEQYPRMDVSRHEGLGFVVHCFEDADSWGFFLADTLSFSAPEIEIEMDGQALEKWPRELFVDAERLVEALDFLLQTGKQKATLNWIRTDAFPREIVWEGREGREAWEKSRAKKDREGE